MAIERIMEYHTLHLRSRILSDVIKELDTKELCVTRLVISADKTIESKTEHYALPELEKYLEGCRIIRRGQSKKAIDKLPLSMRKQTQEMVMKQDLASEEGIDLEYVNKVLTNPPYDFPYVRVEEIGATILKEVPKDVPKKITFKRTRVKQARVVSTLKPQPHAGPKYTLELVTTRQKSRVQKIRELIAERDPIKFCEMVMKSDLVAVCKEVLEPKD